MTKPFAFAELLARLRALARRPAASLPTILQVRDLSLDPATRQVKRGGREIKLTATECRLLEVLMRNAGKAVPRSSILDAVWGFEEVVEENTLDAFGSLLRSKITKASESQLIHTVRGFGYCLRDESHK